jgi:hypothetical protein
VQVVLQIEDDFHQIRLRKKDVLSFLVRVLSLLSWEMMIKKSINILLIF